MLSSLFVSVQKSQPPLNNLNYTSGGSMLQVRLPSSSLATETAPHSFFVWISDTLMHCVACRLSPDVPSQLGSLHARSRCGTRRRAQRL